MPPPASASAKLSSAAQPSSSQACPVKDKPLMSKGPSGKSQLFWGLLYQKWESSSFHMSFFGRSFYKCLGDQWWATAWTSSKVNLDLEGWSFVSQSCSWHGGPRRVGIHSGERFSVQSVRQEKFGEKMEILPQLPVQSCFIEKDMNTSYRLSVRLCCIRQPSQLNIQH